MSKKEKVKEAGKTLLIILLLINTVFLLHETKLYSSAFEFLPSLLEDGSENTQSLDDVDSETLTFGSAFPLAISVSIGEGNRYAAIYDKETVEAEYQRFSAALGEALGSAGDAIKVDKISWEKALARESVYIRFYSAQPLELLSKQLGAEMHSDAAFYLSEELCLSCDEDSTRLFFKTENGEYYTCTTAVSISALRGRIIEYIPNGASFSHEYELLDALDDTILIPGRLTKIYAVSLAGNISQTRISEMLFTSFGLNEFTVSKYTEANGTVVYLDNSSVISVSPAGKAYYSNDGDDSIRLGYNTLESAYSITWQIVNSTLGAIEDDAEVYLSKIEINEAGGDYIFYFDYEINGIPLVLQDGHACVIEFSDERLVAANLWIKSYILSQETIEVLPVFQAAAISADKGNESVKLVYSESSEGIKCIWVDK